MTGQPPVSTAPLWAHQLLAYDYAQSQPNVMLAMGMGTGKTKVATDLIQNSADRRVLIVCRRKVGVNVWPAQLRQWLAHPEDWLIDVLTSEGASVSVAKRTARMQASLAAADRYIAIINYEAVTNEPMASMLRSVEWDRIILDESQHISAHDSKRSKFLAQLKATRRLCLTGTPMHDRPMDVFGQYRFLDPGIYGQSWTRFKFRYARWGGFGDFKLIGYLNTEEFANQFGSIAIEVGRDVLDLPETQHITLPVTLNAATTAAYSAIRKSFVTQLAEGTVTTPNALTQLLRMQQATSGYTTTDDGVDVTLGTDKRDTLAELLEDLPADEPVVVFVRFKHDLVAVHEAAAKVGRSSLEVSGARDECARWQGGEATVLAVQIQSGGEGIDLTRAAYCAYYSIGHSLGDYDQSLARIHRPGQTRPVVYYHLTASATVDVAVYEALDKKRNVIDAVLASLR